MLNVFKGLFNWVILTPRFQNQSLGVSWEFRSLGILAETVFGWVILAQSVGNAQLILTWIAGYLSVHKAISPDGCSFPLLILRSSDMIPCKGEKGTISSCVFIGSDEIFPRCPLGQERCHTPSPAVSAPESRVPVAVVDKPGSNSAFGTGPREQNGDPARKKGGR